MKKPLERVRLGATILLGVVMAAMVGYVFLFEYSWIEAFWLVVVTISSVGYGERSGNSPGFQLFTVGVILVGMFSAAYAFGGFVQLLLEGEIERAMGQRRMSRGIDQLSRHVIVCGFGRTGQLLARELKGRPFVVIDADPERIALAKSMDCLCLQGDASEDAILRAAGLERARTLVSALPNDANNVFITLTARHLCPQIQIIARAEHLSTERKLRQAGANKIVMPAISGARQMVRMITRPHTADLMELMAESSCLDVDLDEMTVPPESNLVGRELQTIEGFRTHNLLVVAVRREDDSMVFNPNAGFTFTAGDSLIMMGKRSDIETLRSKYDLGEK